MCLLLSRPQFFHSHCNRRRTFPCCLAWLPRYWRRSYHTICSQSFHFQYSLNRTSLIIFQLGILAHAFPQSRVRSTAFATFAAGAPVGGAFGMIIGGVLTQLTSCVITDSRRQGCIPNVFMQHNVALRILFGCRILCFNIFQCFCFIRPRPTVNGARQARRLDRSLTYHHRLGLDYICAWSRSTRNEWLENSL